MISFLTDITLHMKKLSVTPEEKEKLPCDLPTQALIIHGEIEFFHNKNQ